MGSTAAAPARQTSGLKAILIGGLLAGFFDITQAVFVFGHYYKIGLARIFQSVAAGALGPKSFQMGTTSAVIGAGFHFFIGIAIAAVFWLASRKLRWMVHSPVISGLAYGIVAFLFMYLVVMPLSARPPAHPLTALFTTPTLITGWFGHPLLIGLPIALIARRFDSN